MPEDIRPEALEQERVCPVSGLPVTTRPEWSGAHFGKDYEISLSLLGDRIILGRVRGRASRESVKMATELATAIMDEVVVPGREYIYIEDFSALTHIAYDARKEYIDFLGSLSHIHTLIICAASPLLRLSVKLARHINTGSFDIRVVKDYAEAVRFATKRLAAIGEGPHGGIWSLSSRTCPVTGLDVHAPESWVIPDSGGGCISFRRIGETILCGLVENWAPRNRESLPLFLAERDRIITEAFPKEARFVELMGFSGVQVSTARQVREAMATSIMKHGKRLKGYVVFGAPTSIRIAYNMGVRLHRPPFPYALCDAYEEAIQKGLTMAEGAPQSARDRRLSPSQAWEKELKEELVEFLTGMNWEAESEEEALEEKDVKHPLKGVYDAISLIKMDIDEIFREHHATQMALKESEELSMALLNATTDLSLLADLSGTVLAANRRAEEQLGESGRKLAGRTLEACFPKALSPYRMAQFRRCVRLEVPVRFQDNLDEHFYDTTLHPIFNAEGRLDRVALYERNITELKQAESHIHTLSQELIKAQEGERQRIARDLHDNVAQDLASLTIETRTFAEDFPELPQGANRRLSHITKVLKRSIGSIRELVYDLRPPSLDQLGLLRTLSRYIADFSEGCGVEVDFQSGGLENLTLDFDTEINIYRLIQEALANVRRHAGATRAMVRLIASHPMLILRIEDNGHGFDVARRSADALGEKRMGLKGMEERTLLLGGTFSIQSEEGRGTRIMVRIPMEGTDG